VALARAHALPPLYTLFRAIAPTAKPVLALEFGAAHCYFGYEGNPRESRDAGQHPGVVDGCWWVLVVWKQEMNDGIKGLAAFLRVWRVSFNLRYTRTTRATLAQLAHASRRV
jgi:hypothetical protein